MMRNCALVLALALLLLPSLASADFADWCDGHHGGPPFGWWDPADPDAPTWDGSWFGGRDSDPPVPPGRRLGWVFLRLRELLGIGPFQWVGDLLGLEDVTEDFGDAPDSYGTLLSSGGARHAIGDFEWLGTRWDGETDGAPGLGADGDGADEDGIWFGDDGAFHAVLTVADWESDRYAKDPDHPESDPYSNLYLDAWLDWGRDGSFEEPDDHVVSESYDPSTWGASSTAVTIEVPGYSGGGPGTYMRWRLSYGAAAASSTGFAAFGEVEDYYVSPEPATLCLLAVPTALAIARRRRKNKRK